LLLAALTLTFCASSGLHTLEQIGLGAVVLGEHAETASDA
jgi:hypothetical protein